MSVKPRAGMVVLVSGGLDSLCLIHALLRQGHVVFPVHLRCGLVWETAELFWLRRWLGRIRHPHLKPLSILHVPLRSVYGHHWSVSGRSVPSARSADRAVYLPGRNVLLLSHAAIFASLRGVSILAIGLLAGNPFGDARPEFLMRLARGLSQALSHPIRIETPLRRFTKAKLIALFRMQPFHLSFSCLQPHGLRHCGRCNKCAERKQAFRHAGVPDPTNYVQ